MTDSHRELRDNLSNIDPAWRGEIKALLDDRDHLLRVLRGFREVFVSDDVPLVMRAYERTLRNMGFKVTVVQPADLITLIPTFGAGDGE